MTNHNSIFDKLRGFSIQLTSGIGFPDKQQSNFTPMPTWMIRGRNRKVNIGGESFGSSYNLGISNSCLFLKN